MKRVSITEQDIGSADSIIKEAAEWIRRGELVAFPTETVYGLGANALDDSAVQKIFVAKGRPSDNPLIVHIAHQDQLLSLVADIPPVAQQLITAFWPGPLTLVFHKSHLVPDSVTAGGQTVAIRMPDHPIAQQLIKKSGVPIAAPSANSSGRPSPTQAEHVQQDLKENNIFLIDAGSTQVGLESTVLDISESTPVLLRSGGVSLEEIENVIGKIVTSTETLTNQASIAKSPGLKYRHYAPKAKVLIAEAKDFLEIISKYPEKKIACITLQRDMLSKEKNISIVPMHSVAEMAQHLFSIFRECDEKGTEIILVESVPPIGIGRALMNRVERASQPH